MKINNKSILNYIMNNKRKKIVLDANRINNYNKFLSTLDNTSNNVNNKYSSRFEEMRETILTEKDIKDELDKMIQQFNFNFNINDHSSSNFTGQKNTDISLFNMEIENPNNYEETIIDNSKYKKIFIKPIKKTVEKIQPTEFITIETEINNIDDILKLINTHKLEPQFKYNINMKALHDIKEPLEELNNMIGMNELKINIVDQILYFVQELHKNKNSCGDFMHTVIYGPPGTGKTEIAKIMGKIYSKIGLLNKGTFKKVTRSDLIAGYLGQTALKTKDVINEALGGVLFIDEAYSLGNT